MQKRWLFITYCSDPKRPYLDAPARYRCFDRAADLRAMGIRASVMSQQRFIREPPLDFDIYVFHRPWFTQDFEGLLAFLRRRGKRVIADYDAPVFSEPMRGRAIPPFQELISNSMPVEVRFSRALKLFENVSAATEVLSDQIRKHHSRASVITIESGLGMAWKEIADSLYRAPAESRNEICVGIGSEFEIDIDLLERILTVAMEKLDGVNFVVDPQVQHQLGRFNERVIEQDDAVGAHAMMMRASMLIVPAKLNPWNVAIPGIRALEATYLGCHVLTSPLPGHVQHAKAGYQFAEREEEWIKKVCEWGNGEPLGCPGNPEYLQEYASTTRQTLRMHEAFG